MLLGSSRQAVNNAYSTLAVEKAIDRAKKADSTKLTAVELKEIIQPSFASVHEPSDMIFYKLHMLFSFQEDCLVSAIQILDLVYLLLH